MQDFEISFWNFSKDLQNSEKFCKSLHIFLRWDDFLVELEKCCKMRIWTRKSASIQPRTSLGKSAVSSAAQPASPPRTSASRGFTSWTPPRCRSTATVRRLLLAWIEADFRVQIRILQQFSKSTRKASSREQICQISAKNLRILQRKKLTSFGK